MCIPFQQGNMAYWTRLIEDATHERDPVLSNLKITRCHYLLATSLQDVLGVAAGANFHSWAVWGSRKAGVTIRQEDLDQARRDGTFVGGIVGALVGFGLGWYLMSWLSWVIVPGMTLFGGCCGAATGRQIIVHSRRASSRLILEGNRTVLEDIGMQTARFIASFHAQAQKDESRLAEFLRQLRPGATETGGQDLLKQAFKHYYVARFADTSQAKHEAAYFANCLAVYHEHIRLEPYIKGSMPWIVRRCVTKRLLQFDIGAVRLAVAHDVPALDGVTYPPSLVALTNPDLRAFLIETLGCQSIDDAPVGTGVRDWTKISERMRYIASLFRALHVDPVVQNAPYDAEQFAAVAAGVRPMGKL